MAQIAAPHIASGDPVSSKYVSNPPATAWSLGERSDPRFTRLDDKPNPDAPVAPVVLLVKPQRDPHQLPTFDGTTLTTLTEPILYLPPLLSSLPPGYTHSLRDISNYRPLNTDSRLPDIDPASFSLHKALHSFRPLSAEYSVTPYAEAFNWSELKLPVDAAGEWYCVVFRSKRKDGSDGGPLYEADKLAHEEAVQNGGLIMYWYGIPHPTSGLNLATCIWQSRLHAIGAMSRPHHVNAMRLAAASYERYELQRFRLLKKAGESNLRVEPYDRGDAGW